MIEDVAGQFLKETLIFVFIILTNLLCLYFSNLSAQLVHFTRRRTKLIVCYCNNEIALLVAETLEHSSGRC